MKSPRCPFSILLAAVCISLSTGCPGNNNPVPGETRTFDGIEFQWCPAGTFLMGSPMKAALLPPDESQHEVTISHGFWLGKYPVTQAQWKAVMGSNPSSFKKNGRPVEQVSWEVAEAFIDTLNAAKGTNLVYRLPTESEWEYACRAGTTTRFYWGDDLAETEIGDFAWYFGNANGKTHVVGRKMPNAWGLYDMSGNVWEWCQDWFGDYPAGPITDPHGPAIGDFRVLRGGSWGDAAEFCRSAARGSSAPDEDSPAFGFRLVRTPN